MRKQNMDYKEHIERTKEQEEEEQRYRDYLQKKA